MGKYSIIQDYSFTQQSPVIVVVGYNTVVTGVTTPCSLTCYDLILWLSHVGRTGYRDAGAGVTTILYSTDRGSLQTAGCTTAPIVLSPFPGDEKGIYTTS